MTKVEAWELQKVNHSFGLNEDKFYRVYDFAGQSHPTVIHYGRNGTKGQWKTQVPTGWVLANKKQNEGYSVTQHALFVINDAELKRPRDQVFARLTALFQIATSGTPYTAPGILPDTDLEAEEEMKATLLRLAGKLMPGTFAEAVVDEPDPMEAKLRAALKRAKGK